MSASPWMILRWYSSGIDDGGDHAVDVGKLLARLVDLVEVWIALERLDRGGEVGNPPRHHRRLVQVVQRRPPEVVAERLRPGVEALFRGHRFGVVVVVDVPLRQVVLGVKRDPLAARPLHHDQLHGEVGFVHLEADRVVVHLHHPADAREQVPGLHLVVPVHVLEREDHVVGGERVAVRPLRPLAHVDGEALAVVGELVAARQVGHHRPVPGHLQEAGADVLGRLGDVVPRVLVDGHHVQRAAVGADLLHRRRHPRFQRQPFVDRRQLSRRHQRRQHRRLLVLAGRNGHLRARLRPLLGGARQQRKRRQQRQRRAQQHSPVNHGSPPCGNPRSTVSDTVVRPAARSSARRAPRAPVARTCNQRPCAGRPTGRTRAGCW